MHYQQFAGAGCRTRTWNLLTIMSSAFSSSRWNSSSSLMHAIFSISAAPLLMLRWSSDRRNDLHSSIDGGQVEVSKCHVQMMAQACDCLALCTSDMLMHRDVGVVLGGLQTVCCQLPVKHTCRGTQPAAGSTCPACSSCPGSSPPS